ncbi:hypothetical protein GOP47_0005733 [Adiantum capillus-veneris]|uniref:GIL1/IRKI C-terminal domain-containing protein n=1 Tax=Adiantum capillus-veneris TaxID=13818 RepID=A0A9D4V645_ADICA|nr:hypothetical protein GOP47_0005733 [Adiantum capillus-veneris]
MGEPNTPAISSKLALKCRSLESILHETFSSVSSLRDALQLCENSGSSGGDNDKGPYMVTGTSQKKAILRELKKLSELRHRCRWQCDGLFTENHNIQTATTTPLAFSDEWSSESEGAVTAAQHFEGAGNSTASLKMELQRKDAEIQNLNATVERLVAKKDKLERRVRKLAERLKASCHAGSGVASTTPDKSWDRLSEEDLTMAVHLMGNSDSVMQQDKMSKKSARTGRDVLGATAPNATGNGVPSRHGGMDSPKNFMKIGSINIEKLNDANFDKQRRRREIVESPVEKPGRLSELKKMFDVSIAEVTDMVSDFSKALVVLMKRAKWDVEEGGVQWVMESHKALAVQSYICMRMFRGFENEDFYMTGRLSWLLAPAKHREECRQQFEAMVQMVEEPLDLLAGMAPGSAFGQFCRKKFLQIIPASMEEALLGDLRHRDCLLQEAGHPHWSRFYQAFVRMAKAIWTVHKLAFSLEQRLSIFQAEKGADFVATIMVSHIPNLELASDTHNLVPKVAFTIMPGFRIGEDVLLKCRVYLNGMKMSSPANSRG